MYPDQLCIVIVQWKRTVKTLLVIIPHQSACGLRLPLSFSYLAEFNRNQNEETASSQIGQNATVLTDQMAEETMPDMVNLNKDDRLFAKYASQPVRIYHSTATSTFSTVQVAHDLLAQYLLSMNSTFKAKLNAFVYFTSKIRVTIVIQGQPFAQGKIVAAFTPRPQMHDTYFNNDYTFYNYNPVNAFIVPNLELDPSKSCSYQIDLPMVNHTGVYSLVSPRGSYSMDLISVNKLGSGTASTASMGICVYVSLVDPSFEGLTTHLAGGLEQERTPSGIVRDVSGVVGSIGRVFPSLSPLTTTVSAVGSAISSVLSYFGYAKPPAHEFSTYILNRTCDNYSQSDGRTTGIVLAASQNLSKSIDPALGAGSLADMDIDTLCKKRAPIIIDNPGFDLGVAAETNALNFAVNPTVCYNQGSGNLWYPTPIAGLANMFRAWRGDLDFEFEFVCSPFHRATVLIAWDPLGTGVAPSFADALTLLYNTSVQISGNTKVIITVPWRQILPALAMPEQFSDPQTSTSVASNGWIYTYVVNPVTNNGGVDGIRTNVFVTSSNISFFAPVPTKLAGYYGVVSLASGAEVETQRVTFGSPSSTLNIRSSIYGDSPRSVKDIASRAVQYIYLLGSGFNDLLVQNYPSIPTILSTGRNINLEWTYVGWLASAYVGIRGSLYYTAGSEFTPATPQKTNLQLLDLSHHLHSVLNVPYSSAGLPYEDAYAWSQPNLAVASRADTTVPMSVPYHFMPRGIYVAYSDLVNFGFPDAQSTTIGSGLDVAIAAGDDMTFCWFVGFPCLSLTGPT